MTQREIGQASEKNSDIAYRTERDPVGEMRVPADVLYGIQTLRALENFRVSPLRVHAALITAYAEIKKAAALTNMRTGKLDEGIGSAIAQAADEVISGRWRDQFDLDAFQAGAGTSYNMNMNEVIANRALEILGQPRGDYDRINPNDHVNKSQSTNDTMPTAMRIAAVRLLGELVAVLDRLAASFAHKAEEFKGVKKSACTRSAATTTPNAASAEPRFIMRSAGLWVPPSWRSAP